MRPRVDLESTRVGLRLAEEVKEDAAANYYYQSTKAEDQPRSLNLPLVFGSIN